MKHISITILALSALLTAFPTQADNNAGLSVGNVLSNKQQPINQEPPRHELLALTPNERDSRTGEILDQTAWEFLYYNQSSIKDFAEQLCKRIRWDLQVTDEMAEGKRPKDANLEKKLIDECKVFVDFMLRLGMIAEQHTNVRMKRNNKGEWSYSLTPAPQFETKSWTTHVPKAVKKKDANGYAACMVNGVYYFCERPFGGGFVPVILDNDEMYVANIARALIRNIALMYEYGTLDLLKELFPNDKDQFERSYQTSLLYLDAVSKAINNNDKIEVQYKPMPKAGALNASMKAKVLPIEKSITSTVTDCVVTSDSWEVQRDAAGNIQRRVIYGYSIVQTKRGKQATRVSWAEDYLGGGKYGAVHSYGVGGGQFYVK